MRRLYFDESGKPMSPRMLLYFNNPDGGGFRYRPGRPREGRKVDRSETLSAPGELCGVCAVCGDAFKLTQDKRRYCTRACKKIASYQRNREAVLARARERRRDDGDSMRAAERKRYSRMWSEYYEARRQMRAQTG